MKERLRLAVLGGIEMEISCIIEILNQNYNINIKNIELFREGGNLAYVVYDENKRFFLKIIRPPFIENTLYSIDIQLYLMKNQFPIIPIVLTNKDTACIFRKHPDTCSGNIRTL